MTFYTLVIMVFSGVYGGSSVATTTVPIYGTADESYKLCHAEASRLNPGKSRDGLRAFCVKSK